MSPECFVPARFFRGCVTTRDNTAEECDDERERRRRTRVRVVLNLFPGVLRGTAIKRERMGQRAIYARRDYLTDNRQRPDNRRNFGGRFRTEGRSNLSPSTYLTIALSRGGAAPRGARVNGTFVIVLSNCPGPGPRFSPLLSFNDHRIHCLDLETSEAWGWSRNESPSRPSSNAAENEERGARDKFHIFFVKSSLQSMANNR